ncbi:MAG: tetratricopeptide repeat protein [Candidatus Omnitrophica bacterium]|nr:tetratricopeptide repeat protein [Candidatus Omnitrophota bacterium]
MIKRSYQILLSFSFVALLFSSTVVFAQGPAKELFEQAQAFADQGDTAKAIEYYEKVVDADPDFAPAYSGLASVYLDNNGKTEDVIWLYQQAAALEPQNAENYTNMCRAYFQSQQNDWAESACLKALSIEPNSGSAQLSLAWIYLLGKVQPAESVKYFTAVIEKIPNNPKIYYGLGMAYARNNQQAEALDVITNLRSMGQENLASQLEKMIRPSAEAMMPPPGVMRPPGLGIESGPSKVVKAQPEETPPPPVVDPNAPPPGTIRIQLKAKLPPASGATTASSEKSKTKEKSEDDGHDVEDYKPLSIKEMQERVKRMRGATGKMSGSANVSTQTRSAP